MASQPATSSPERKPANSRLLQRQRNTLVQPAISEKNDRDNAKAWAGSSNFYDFAPASVAAERIGSPSGWGRFEAFVTGARGLAFKSLSVAFDTSVRDFSHAMNLLQSNLAAYGNDMRNTPAFGNMVGGVVGGGTALANCLQQLLPGEERQSANPLEATNALLMEFLNQAPRSGRGPQF